MGAHMHVPLVLLIMQYPGQLLRELVQAQKKLINSGSVLFETV